MVRWLSVVVVVALFSVAQGFLTFLKLKEAMEKQKENGANPPPSCPLPVHAPTLSPTNLPSSVSQTLQLINETVQSILINNKCPGATYVTIVSGENTIFSQGYNSISETDKTITTDTTLFRLASVSKVFTLMELLHQYQNGNVAMDVDISEYVPEFQVTKPANDPQTKLTFNSISAQTSGLPRECPCFFYGCHMNNAQIFERYHGTPLLWLPERLPSYSNFGFALIGNTLGAIYPLNQTTIFDGCLEYAGTESCHFFSGVHQDILAPLEMSSTGFILNVDVQGEVAQGFRQTSDSVTPIPDHISQAPTGWESPAGSMFSCHRDMAKLMSYILKYLNKEDPVSLPLSSSALREWMTPHIINNDGVTGYGRPWEIYYVESASLPGVGFWANTKGGDLPGYTANLVFVQDLNLGIMVTVAAGDSLNSDMTSFATAKMVDTLASYYYSLPQIPLLPANYSLYTGKYVVNMLQLSEEQRFMFDLLNDGKQIQNPPFFNIEYVDNNRSLHFTFSAGGDFVIDMSLFRSRVIVGDQDYWQLLIPNLETASNFYPFYVGNCDDMTAGYEGVHVVFKMKGNEVISLEIPTELYGVSFLKI